MIRFAALYPKTSDSHFDMDYYLSKHIPMVQQLFEGNGLVRIEVDEGIASGAPDEPVPFAVMASMTFSTMEALQEALKNHALEVLADIPNFTNVQPQIQINQIMK